MICKLLGIIKRYFGNITYFGMSLDIQISTFYIYPQQSYNGVQSAPKALRGNKCLVVFASADALAQT